MSAPILQIATKQDIAAFAGDIKRAVATAKKVDVYSLARSNWCNCSCNHADCEKMM